MEDLIRDGHRPAIHVHVFRNKSAFQPMACRLDDGRPAPTAVVTAAAVPIAIATDIANTIARATTTALP